MRPLSWALVIVGLALALWVAAKAKAEPIAQAVSEGVTIVLTDEKCALPEIINAPNRATWTENGKTLEGCAGLHPAGIVFLYFADRTVVLLPRTAFVKVNGA